MNRIKSNSNPVLWLVILAFLVNTIFAQTPVQAEPDVPFLPVPGTMVSLTPSFSPPLIRGLKVFKNNPFKFEIVMSQGDTASSDAEGDNALIKQALLKEEANKLVGYFLAALTVPEKDMWVNLSPYERNRIVPKEFGITEMGKELLAQDYLLKQVTASVMYPEGAVGREFWHRIYAEAYKRFGTTNIPVNTFNKVWIVPDAAVVYENGSTNTIVILKSSLKVMLEEDYLALDKNTVAAPQNNVHSLGSQIVREIIIPQLTKEVNEGKNFAVLRQVYNSLILAFWYKNKLKQSLIAKGYVDRNKINGVDVNDKQVDQKIYDQYLRSYKKGVYNYIKEEVDPAGQTTPRKYFSGGVEFGGTLDRAMEVVSDPDSAMSVRQMLKSLSMFVLTIGLAATFALAGPSKASAQQSGVPAAGLTNSFTVAPNGSVYKTLKSIGQEKNFGAFMAHHHKRISIFRNHHRVNINDFRTQLQPGDQLSIDLTGYVEKGASPAVQGFPDTDLFHGPEGLTPGSLGAELPLVQPNHHAAFPSLEQTVKLFPATALPPAVTFHNTTAAVPYLTTQVTGAVTGSVAGPRVAAFPSPQQTVNMFPATASPVATFHSTTAPVPYLTDSLHPSAETAVQPSMRPAIKGKVPLPPYKPASLIAAQAQAPAAAPNATVTVSAPVANITQAIEKERAYIAKNDKERRMLEAQIRASAQADALRAQQKIEAEETARSLKLSIPKVYPFTIPPYQSLGTKPYVVVTPDQWSLAYIYYQMAQIDKLAGTPDVRSPASVRFTPYHWQPYLSWQLGNQGLFSVVPDLPGRELLDGVQIAQGLAHFGTLPLAGQIGGPIFGAQIIADLRNYVVMHPTRGQGIRYDTRVKDPLTGLLKTLTIEVTPVKSFDQNGYPVDEYLVDIGPAQLILATLGQLDKVLGGLNIVGNPDLHFPFQDIGFQIKAGNYERAFAIQSAFNTDPNTTYIKLYSIDSPARYRRNANNGWSDVPASTPFDSHFDFYAATVNGFVLRRDPATGKISGQRIFTSPTFVTDEFARVQVERQSGHKVVGRPYLEHNASFMERISSKQDLENEAVLLKGMDAQGHIIWGVLRDPVSGRIVRFITDPRELNTISRVKGTAIGFVPGKVNQAPGENAGNIIKDYAVDEVTRVLQEWTPQREKERFEHYDLSARPQLTSIPPGLVSLVSGNSLIFDPSVALRAINGGYGVIYFGNGNIPEVLRSMEHVHVIGTLGEANGVHKLANGEYFIDGFPRQKQFTSDTLVLLGANGKVIGYIDPSDKLRQERIKDIERINRLTALRVLGFENYGNAIDQNGISRPITTLNQAAEFVPAKYAGDGVVGQEFVIKGKKPIVITGDMLVKVDSTGKVVAIIDVTLGKKLIEDREVVLSTLAAGGVEAQDQRVTAPNGKPKITVFAKGNSLTPAQIRLGILPEGELVRLILSGQATYVPIAGSDKQQLIILEKAPAPLGQLQQGGANEQTKKIATLVGPDGKPFYGMTIDAQTFKMVDILKLKDLDATGIRTYYPIPISIAKYLVSQTKVKTIIVGIPLDAHAYDKNILSNFWGGPVPVGAKRISLEGNNYISYLKQLADAVGPDVKIVVDLGNELNFASNYPRWTGQPDNEATYKQLFTQINEYAQNIEAALGTSVTTSFTLGDRPGQFALAFTTAPDVGVWGINYYRHDGSLADDIARATQQAGISPYFYIAEAGSPSDTTGTTQADIVMNDWQLAQGWGVSITFMSLEDNPMKLGAVEKTYGWYHDGTAKPVVAQMIPVWRAAAVPAPLDNNTLTAMNENNWFFVRGDGQGLWHETMQLQDLKDPQKYEKVRLESNGEIIKFAADGHVIYKVYLDGDSRNSRVEVMGANGTSLIYALPSSFLISDLSKPVASTTSYTDTNGLVHVTTTDLQVANYGSTVEDVFQQVPGAQPIKLYSKRPLQQEVIYFDKYGHQQYSVSMDITREPGQTVIINGKTVEHVTGIYKYVETDKVTNSGYGYDVSLRDITRHGWVATTRRTEFKDGRTDLDQTGFIKLEPGLSDQQIMERVEKQGVLDMRDQYFYNTDGTFDHRQVSFMANGNWHDAWTLRINYIGTAQAATINQIIQAGLSTGQSTQNDAIKQAFAKLGISASTNLVETVRVTTQGVTTRDYRLPGDKLERKIFSVITQDGVDAVEKIIVGLDFDPVTGEQTRSYELTPDFQVKSEFKTMPNDLSLKELFPDRMAEYYAQFMQEHLGISDADLLKDLRAVGFSENFVPIMVQERPFILKTDNPVDDGYKLIESQIRELKIKYEKAMKENKAEAPAILDQINALWLGFHNTQNNAHYSSQQGQASYIFLSPPGNSLRSQYVFKKGREGDKDVDILELWMLEGIGPFPVNILPGTIIVDNKTDQLVRTMAFDHQEKDIFKDAGNNAYDLRVNYYTVNHDLHLTGSAFISLGNLVSRDSPFVRNQPLHGRIGDETRGTERSNFSPLYPYELFTNAILIADTDPNNIGWMTANPFYLNYYAGVDKNGAISQDEDETALRDRPTAPGEARADILFQTIENGVPVEGSKTQLDVVPSSWQGLWQSIKSYVWVIPLLIPVIYFGSLAVVFFIGRLIRNKRLSRVKAELAQEPASGEGLQPKKNPPSIGNVVSPSWEAYGSNPHAVEIAKSRWEGTIIPKLRKQSMDDILKRYFKAYQIWRNKVMKIETPFTPTVEDLWVMFLIDADNGFFAADTPDVLEYLMHKSIEARQKYGSKADVHGFVRKEYTRWSDIMELQSTSFQSPAAGIMRNVLPYDDYLKKADIEDLFRTREFIEWYDNLGVTLDGNQDLRDVIYKDLIVNLKQKVDALREGIKKLAEENGDDPATLRRLLKKVPAYNDYVDFFSKVQNGEYQVSDHFSSQKTIRETANLKINHEALMKKTYFEGALPVGRWGKWTFLLRFVTVPLVRYLSNDYKQSATAVILSSAVLLGVAIASGFITLTTAAAWAVGGLVAIVLVGPWLLNRYLNWGLSKSHGKPVDFWAGYNKVKLTSSQFWYRAGYWGLMVLPFAVAWDVLSYHFFFIPTHEMINAVWYPVILGYQVLINCNPVLLAAMWSVSILFIYLAKHAPANLSKPHFTFIRGSMKGVGTIQTADDLRSLEQDNDSLNKLIERELLPQEGVGLSPQQRTEGREKIIQGAFDNYRSRDEVSNRGYKRAVEEGRLDGISIPEVQEDIVTAVNGLLMDGAPMPGPDKTNPYTVIVPVYGEDIISDYEQLDRMQSTGYTQLNHLISVAPERWKNLIERLAVKGIATRDELRPQLLRMVALLGKDLKGSLDDDNGAKGRLGPVNEDLKMQIRLWASYELQPFARTLDGMMNLVRTYQIYLGIAHPDWNEQQIQQQANEDIQFIWAYQIWGKVLNAKDDQPALQLKREDTLFLLKKYWDELKYQVTIASLQQDEKTGMWQKVLSYYDPKTEKIVDKWRIDLTKNNPITVEGKGANQMYALSFARHEFRFAIDMNQDLDFLEAIKVQKVLQRFDDQEVGAVNLPEKINSNKTSKTGEAVAHRDQTFSQDELRHAEMVSGLGFFGHSYFWRDIATREAGGMGNTELVSEDYAAGELAQLRGIKLVQEETMRTEKSREVSAEGTNTMVLKFAMGGGQAKLSRLANWMNRYYGVVAGAGKNTAGPKFYEIMAKAILAIGLFVAVVMVGGVSPFVAIPMAAVAVMYGVFLIGQSTMFHGISHMHLNHGTATAQKKFWNLIAFMGPYNIAEMFTIAHGFFMGLTGRSSYQESGRKSGRENKGIVQLADSLDARAQVLTGVKGLLLTGIGLYIWWNWTYFLSLFTIITFIIAATTLILMVPGNLPYFGVSRRISAALFKKNLGVAGRSLGDVVGKNGKVQGNMFKEGIRANWSKMNLKNTFSTAVRRSVIYGLFIALIGPKQIRGLIQNRRNGPPEYPGLIKPAVVDKAMKAPGGIDLGRTVVKVKSSGELIQTAFDDPAMLRLLLNSDGLAPIIYDITVMTPSMVDHFVGVN